MTNYHSDDRPDPSEQPIRARVPDHVAAGAFSTGVIVMTAQTEFILDFVQNLGRPHQIVARVVMPHYVLPQLVDAMQRNIELYRNRWGELPQTGLPRFSGQDSSGGSSGVKGQGAPAHLADAPGFADDPFAAGKGGAVESSNASRQSAGGASGSRASAGDNPNSSTGMPAGDSQKIPREPGMGGPNDGGNAGNTGHSGGRQASVQEIYDDLKIRDEFLSGAYANAVMIGHGPHEFSFDFITNFYPHSAVSARVFLAAGQIPRLFESLKGTWEQLRNRMQPPPENPFPPPGGEPPFA